MWDESFASNLLEVVNTDNVVVGLKVQRGPGWKRGAYEDGGIGGVGLVIGFSDEAGACTGQMPRGLKAHCAVTWERRPETGPNYYNISPDPEAECGPRVAVVDEPDPALRTESEQLRAQITDLKREENLRFLSSMKRAKRGKEKGCCGTGADCTVS